nr:hypothetical protein [uncultured Draconibacterium sp.]
MERKKDIKTIIHKYYTRCRNMEELEKVISLFNDPLNNLGKEEGRVGSSNSWPIDMLQERDVYLADSYGKVIDGMLIGENLGNSISAKYKDGVVFDGGAHNMEGFSEIEGFNVFVRGGVTK